MPDPICPFARQRLLARASSKPIIHPTASAAHTAVTTANGQQLGDFFEHADADAHFYVDRDGSLWQYLPVDRKSWAQFLGNDHVVAYETWDGGAPSTPWNPAQLDTIAHLLAWLYRSWDVPLDVSSTSTGPGAGWHSKYPEWNADAHNCPGSTRVGQLVQEVIPAAHRLVDLPTPPQEDDSMKPVAGTPSWCGRQSDGAFPRFKATLDGADAVVVSIDNAPFTPAWAAGTHGGFTDFAAFGLWCRRFVGAGEPFAFGEVSGSFFLISDHGTFDVAARPAGLVHP